MVAEPVKRMYAVLLPTIHEPIIACVNYRLSPILERALLTFSSRKTQVKELERDYSHSWASCAPSSGDDFARPSCEVGLQELHAVAALATSVRHYENHFVSTLQWGMPCVSTVHNTSLGVKPPLSHDRPG